MVEDERVFSDGVTDSGFFGSEGGDGAEALDPAVVELVDELLACAPAGREGLIQVLLGLQETFDRVSWRVQELVADQFGLSPAQVAGVVSFYPALSSERQGRPRLDICTGTACFLRGGDRTFECAKHEAVERAPEGGDTGLAVIQERCFGVCGLAPVVRTGMGIQPRSGADEIHEVVETMVGSPAPERNSR